MQNNDSTSTTKYSYIRGELLRRIDSGEFPPGGRIPSENALSHAYGVSVMTARKALADLVHAGRIIRIKGKGSFVAPLEAAAAPQQNGALRSVRGIVPLVLLSYQEDDSSFVSIVGGAQTCLSGSGYAMTVECSNRDLATEGAILDRCMRDKVAGVLIFSTDPDGSVGRLAALAAAGIPFVLLDRAPEALPVTSVASYHFDGMYRVTRHLLDHGHRGIVYIANELPTNVHRERLHGYRMALESAGVPFRPELCLTENYPQLHLLDSLIQTGATAVACINDRTAVAVMEHLEAGGHRVPDDISVTGFDDSELGRYASLTSVRQPFREIGRLSAEKLLALMDGQTGHSRVQLPVELVIRASTGPVGRGAPPGHSEKTR